jgi:c(7)-type cytochrome triheme protein
MQENRTGKKCIYAVAVMVTGLLFGLFAMPESLVAGLRFPKKDLIFSETGNQPHVVFNHEKHVVGKKLKCTKCHTKIFQMKAGRTAKKKGKLTMAAMRKGQFCGACHNGTKAFSVKEEDKNCARCHVK